MTILVGQVSQPDDWRFKSKFLSQVMMLMTSQLSKFMNDLKNEKVEYCKNETWLSHEMNECRKSASKNIFWEIIIFSGVTL